ncbi:hypothetical protein N7467_010294, partial [Penicillium canescens]
PLPLQGLPLAENTGTNATLDPCPSTIAIQRADNDPEYPYALSSRRKWLAVISLVGFTLRIRSELRSSEEIASLGLSLFIWGMGKLIFVLCRDGLFELIYVFFFIGILPCAFAKNIQTLLIGGLFSRSPGSTFLRVAGGRAGDVFPRHRLAFPMMVYTASSLIGPEIGPLRIKALSSMFSKMMKAYTALKA